ncbi:MAG: hypothetical protein ABIX01_16780 [Chitinophagaceae bacterium]
MRSFPISLFVVFFVHAHMAAAQTSQLVWTQQEILKQSYRPFIKEVKPIHFAGTDTSWLPPAQKKSYFPPNFYTQNMGAVCKVELKMQKRINFPLFIRLGGKDYVDQMEGKFSPRR